MAQDSRAAAKPGCSRHGSPVSAAFFQHRILSFMVATAVFAALYLLVSGVVLHAFIQWYPSGIAPELVTLTQLGICVLLGAVLAPAVGKLIAKKHLKGYTVFLGSLTLASLVLGEFFLHFRSDWLAVSRCFPQLLSVVLEIPAEATHLLLLYSLMKRGDFNGN